MCPPGGRGRGGGAGARGVDEVAVVGGGDGERRALRGRRGRRCFRRGGAGTGAEPERGQRQHNASERGKTKPHAGLDRPACGRFERILLTMTDGPARILFVRRLLVEQLTARADQAQLHRHHAEGVGRAAEAGVVGPDECRDAVEGSLLQLAAVDERPTSWSARSGDHRRGRPCLCFRRSSCRSGRSARHSDRRRSPWCLCSRRSCRRTGRSALQSHRLRGQ